jgi:ATP-dependent Clp protease ATP-binding subunit ClpA
MSLEDNMFKYLNTRYHADNKSEKKVDPKIVEDSEGKKSPSIVGSPTKFNKNKIIDLEKAISINQVILNKKEIKRTQNILHKELKGMIKLVGEDGQLNLQLIDV